MRVLHVSSEVDPWCMTGGLADVAGALPPALRRADPTLDVAILLPLYREVAWRAVRTGHRLKPTGLRQPVTIDGRRLVADVVEAEGAAVPTFFLDVPELYDRDGLYVDASGRDHPDNPVRFGFLCRASLGLAGRLLGGPVDVVHCHDWQTGQIPVLLSRAAHPRPATVLTIHNLKYQGIYGKQWMDRLYLDWRDFHVGGLEYHDHLDLLKGGIGFADLVTTVSPTYAAEILTPEHGEGLDGFLRTRVRRLEGVLNGIDTTSWDPATDPALPAPFDATDLAGKAACRQALLDEMGLEAADDEPVFIVVSRLAQQKGLDLVAQLVPELPAMRARLVVLGSGDAGLARWFAQLAEALPRHVALRLGFDPPLARRMYAGADALLMPSRFEACGLAQQYAMRYGTVPVVRAVGGLRDTVHDPGDAGLAAGEGTGFCHAHADLAGLRWAVQRAVTMFRDDPEGWARVRAAGMARDASWDGPARRYLELYRELISDEPVGSG